MASGVPIHAPVRSSYAEKILEGKFCIKSDVVRDSTRNLPRIKMKAAVQEVEMGSSTWKDSVASVSANTKLLDHVKNCENKECSTPKSKAYLIHEVTVCPGAPRKVPPKRKFQSSLGENFFVPPDLEALPAHIKALFR